MKRKLTRKQPKDGKEPCCNGCAYARLGFNVHHCLLKTKKVNAFDWCPDWVRTFEDADDDLLNYDGTDF